MKWYYIRQCAICQRSKSDHAAYPGLLQPLQIPYTTWSSITRDFIDGLPKSHGKTTVFVVVDRLTKYAHFTTLTHPYTASTVAQTFMDQVFKLHGMPENVVNDRDPIFISRFWHDLFTMEGAELSTSITYHPQSDGQTEAVNRTLEIYLTCYCADSQNNWSMYLSLAECTTFHSAYRPVHIRLFMDNKPLHTCLTCLARLLMKKLIET